MKTQNYLLRNIPVELWKAAKYKTIEEGITLRTLILRAIRNYIK